MQTENSYHYFVSTHQGLVRTNNEDFYGDGNTPFGHVFIVCDGMGGHAAGEKASLIAVETILDFLKNCDNENHQENLKAAIVKANDNILDETTKDPSLKGMGTTCVVLYLLNNYQYLTGHVGDSRIYEYKQRQLSRITKDHSYVQFLVDTGEITPEEAETHKSKNQILRALGADDTVKPDVSDIKTIQNATSFILCSDGLSDLVNDKSISNVLQQYKTFSKETVEHLVSEALNAGGKDNVTVGLLSIDIKSNTLPIFEKKEVQSSTRNKGLDKKLFLLIFGLILAIGAFAFVFLNKAEKKEAEPTQNNNIEKSATQKDKSDINENQEKDEIETIDSTSSPIDSIKN